MHFVGNESLNVQIKASSIIWLGMGQTLAQGPPTLRIQDGGKPIHIVPLHLCPLIADMSSDVMWYSGQSYPVIYRATRGSGLVKRLRCSNFFKQKYSFKGGRDKWKIWPVFSGNWSQENMLFAWSLRTGSLASHIIFFEVLSGSFVSAVWSHRCYNLNVEE